jgi:hypothetical protein
VGDSEGAALGAEVGTGNLDGAGGGTIMGVRLGATEGTALGTFGQLRETEGTTMGTLGQLLRTTAGTSGGFMAVDSMVTTAGANGGTW